MTERIHEILQIGLEKGLINQQDVDDAEHYIEPIDWDHLQPILDKAQGVEPYDPVENEERLKQARLAHPLYRKDFSPEELEWMKEEMPEEYELLL